MNEFPIMSPNDVAELLQIKESTLRKYSLLLESVGYKFQRNNQNQRWYSDINITALKKLITLKNSTDMNLKDCAEAVLIWSKGENITLPSTVTENATERHNDNRNGDIKVLTEKVDQQTELIEQQNVLLQELMKKMDEQQRYIDERLEQRDRKLIESLRESQEVKQQLLQIAAAHEDEKKKKGFWSKIFG